MTKRNIVFFALAFAFIHGCAEQTTGAPAKKVVAQEVSPKVEPGSSTQTRAEANNVQATEARPASQPPVTAPSRIPPEEFLRLMVGLQIVGPSYPELAGMGEITVQQFVESLRPGRWEQIDGVQWIYRIDTHDQLKNEKIAMAIQFQVTKPKYIYMQDGNHKEVAPDLKVALISRLVVNNDEATIREIEKIATDSIQRIFKMRLSAK